MTALELLGGMALRAELAGGAGVLAVMALRAPARRLFGAELAYRLWILPLVAAGASLFPTLGDFLEGGRARWASLAAPLTPAVIAVWLAGAVLFAVAMGFGEWSFRRLARQGRAGPAATGVSWPRLIVPNDYRERFTERQRAFIREHERVHIAEGHLKANLLIALAQAVSWFNPLVHLAAVFARVDQELACDAVVIARHPRERRAYAEALIKAQAQAGLSPLACFLNGHPLELRIRLLAQRPVSLRRYMVGLSAISAACALAVLLLWSFGPP